MSGPTNTRATVPLSAHKLPLCQELPVSRVSGRKSDLLTLRGVPAADVYRAYSLWGGARRLSTSKHPNLDMVAGPEEIGADRILELGNEERGRLAESLDHGKHQAIGKGAEAAIQIIVAFSHNKFMSRGILRV